MCKAVIPPNYLLQYEASYHASTNSKEARKRHNEFVMDNVVTDQIFAVGTMLDHQGLLHVPHASIASGLVLATQVPLAVMVILRPTPQPKGPSSHQYLHPSRTSGMFANAIMLHLSLQLLICSILRTFQIG